MAFTHIQLSEDTFHGRLLRACMQHLEVGHESLDDIIATITTMIDGDGSSSTHFPEVTARFGFQNDAQSKAAYEELQSLASKFNTDGSVTFVKTALAQAFNKFR